MSSCTRLALSQAASNNQQITDKHKHPATTQAGPPKQTTTEKEERRKKKEKEKENKGGNGNGGMNEWNNGTRTRDEVERSGRGRDRHKHKGRCDLRRMRKAKGLTSMFKPREMKQAVPVPTREISHCIRVHPYVRGARGSS
eukprot:scaffold175891_cov31-Tisochrysis_lutea.AAC.2